METTITLAFFAETPAHLEQIERELKQFHGLQVLLVTPKELTAPALLSLGIGKKAEAALPDITRTLYEALHASTEQARTITLVTIEGDTKDITNVSEEELARLIKDAYQNQ
jgi:hypothetical protein